MSAKPQISAFIAPTTKQRLERHVRGTGVKKAHLVETALLHYLSALDELPTDVIVSARLVVSKESGARLRERLEKPRTPTPELTALMKKPE